MNAPTRPLLRWFGGKFRLADWIVGLMPPHQIYVEPFAGAASVLMRKPRSYNEVLNDLDGDLVNLFRVMQAPEQARALVKRLRLTPYAQLEYDLAMTPAGDDPVERAARLVIRSHMGHGSNAARADRAAGFRVDGRSGTTNVAGEWAAFPSAMAAMVRRLKGVNIRSVPAGDLIDDFRDPKVLLYLDPPYLPATRSIKRRQGEAYHAYSHEMTVADHQALLTQLADHPAMIMLSGYDAELYRDQLAGWECHRKAARAHRNIQRTECLWLNPSAAAARSHGPLFGAVA